MNGLEQAEAVEADERSTSLRGVRTSSRGQRMADTTVQFPRGGHSWKPTVNAHYPTHRSKEMR